MWTSNLLCWCRVQSTPAAIIEMTAVDEPPAPAVVHQPTEPIVQQAEPEVVSETKYVCFLSVESRRFQRQMSHFLKRLFRRFILPYVTESRGLLIFTSTARFATVPYIQCSAIGMW